ncbi:SUMF1/EgtB/PvdO family nonheme iron enzyme [Fluviicola sp.]|uniref:SUMF1/EgtB/PvdO family nonheme iron enzyme n=1 Tax=Fluviicola sp. TaxID=1917219 RepID=UPI0031D75410
MKKLIACFVFSSLGCVAQVESGSFSSIIPIQKSPVFDLKTMLLPRNVVIVNTDYGALRTEVSIYEYYLFLSFLHSEPGVFQQRSNSPEAYFPDLNQVEPKVLGLWKSLIDGLSKPLSADGPTEALSDLALKVKIKVPVKLDAKQRVLAAFPLTGISYEAAVNYAEWMSFIYQKYLSEGDDYSWKFQLPTEEQWEEMALGGLGEKMKPNQVLDSVNAEGCFLFNYANLPDCKSLPGYLKSSLGGGTAPVKSFNPDFLGLHNVFGNVAEMTLTKGICKGGSYFHKTDEAKVPNQIPYAGPQPWLGIRLVIIPVPIP